MLLALFLASATIAATPEEAATRACDKSIERCKAKIERLVEDAGVDGRARLEAILAAAWLSHGVEAGSTQDLIELRERFPGTREAAEAWEQIAAIQWASLSESAGEEALEGFRREYLGTSASKLAEAKLADLAMGKLSDNSPPEEWDAFLERFGDSRHGQQAQQGLARALFGRGDEVSLIELLTRFPKDVHAEQARDRLGELISVSSAWGKPRASSPGQPPHPAPLRCDEVRVTWPLPVAVDDVKVVATRAGAPVSPATIVAALLPDLPPDSLASLDLSQRAYWRIEAPGGSAVVRLPAPVGAPVEGVFDAWEVQLKTELGVLKKALAPMVEWTRNADSGQRCEYPYRGIGVPRLAENEGHVVWSQDGLVVRRRGSQVSLFRADQAVRDIYVFGDLAGLPVVAARDNDAIWLLRLDGSRWEILELKGDESRQITAFSLGPRRLGYLLSDEHPVRDRDFGEVVFSQDGRLAFFSVPGATGGLVRVGDSWALIGLRSNEVFSFRGGGDWRGDKQGFATWQVFTEDDPHGEFGGPVEMVVWPPRTLPDEEALSSRLFEREGVLYGDLRWRPPIEYFVGSFLVHSLRHYAWNPMRTSCDGLTVKRVRPSREIYTFDHNGDYVLQRSGRIAARLFSSATGVRVDFAWLPGCQTLVVHAAKSGGGDPVLFPGLDKKGMQILTEEGVGPLVLFSADGKHRHVLDMRRSWEQGIPSGLLSSDSEGRIRLHGGGIWSPATGFTEDAGEAPVDVEEVVEEALFRNVRVLLTPP